MSGAESELVLTLKAGISKLFTTKDKRGLDDVFAHFEDQFDRLAMEELGTEHAGHVDCVVYDEKVPAFVRWWIVVNRLPAGWKMLLDKVAPLYPLYAAYKGKRVRVTMASRMGDLGIDESLDRESGYSMRCNLSELSAFSKGEPPRYPTPINNYWAVLTMLGGRTEVFHTREDPTTDRRIMEMATLVVPPNNINAAKDRWGLLSEGCYPLLTLLQIRASISKSLAEIKGLAE